MRIGVPRETDPTETRIALTPESTERLVGLGLEVVLEPGLGEGLQWEDGLYTSAGGKVVDREELIGSSDILLRVRKPPLDEVKRMRSGAVHASFLDPFNERPLIEAMAASDIRAFSMEMIPRSTAAQKMDALSSQHSLAGYYMVVLAAERLGKALPMMMTPAGTIQPARVFVIGAGVAGLQAIATAKRLGARVEGFDTRPVVAEQVESLGARFLRIDLGETGQTEQGYARELTPEQKRLQQEGMTEACARSDIVVTTAQLFGKPAPRVMTRSMLKAMKPGAVVVDYAVESGGNVEGSVPGEEVRIEGVRVIGLKNYPGRVARDASRMYANNLFYLVDALWDREKGVLDFDRNREISTGALITADGKIVNPVLQKHFGLDR
ncbi:MAG: NAD(P) transhydrogenase subunit alpha [Desulfobacterales bacterium]